MASDADVAPVRLRTCSILLRSAMIVTFSRAIAITLHKAVDSGGEFRCPDRMSWDAIAPCRTARHPLITRKVIEHGQRFWHTANVREPIEIDEDLRALSTEVRAKGPGAR